MGFRHIETTIFDPASEFLNFLYLVYLLYCCFTPVNWPDPDCSFYLPVSLCRKPPRTRMMFVTVTHDRYGRTTQPTNGAFTHRVSSGAPQPDGVLNNAARIMIRHYRQLYADKPDPIIFIPVAVNTAGRGVNTAGPEHCGSRSVQGDRYK